MVELQSFVDKNAKLYSLPDTYTRLKEVIDDPDSALPEAADVIACDPAMTMRILRLVNSAFFGFGQEIETVSHGVNMLGLQQLHDLVLATSVTEAFSDLSIDVMSMQAYWHKSMYCGVLSRELAIRCNVLDSERLFVAGLLADIGHLLMYEKLPREMEAVLQSHEQRTASLVQLEQLRFGFDYSQVGQALMSEWGLPESLQSIVGFHTRPSQAMSNELQVAIVHIAHLISSIEGNITEDIFKQIDSSALQLTALSFEDLQLVQQQSIDQLAQAENLLYSADSTA